ncbi:MAG: hypothetical protein QGG40_01440 [Myxococcota bacterium]|jgi:hypothetical protein|nr:hypothetical protein [Myxococcota bacterium]
MKDAKNHLGAICLLWILAALVLWPTGRLPEALGHSTGDMIDHLWGTWWFGGKLLQGELPLHTSITHLPEGATLWHVDPVGGLIGLFLRPLGFPLAWNGVLWIQVGLSITAAYAAAWDWTGDRWSACLAGVLVGLSPFSLGLLYSGLSEYLGLWAPVGATWLLIRNLDRDPRGRPAQRHGIVLTGLAIGVCGLQALYYAAFAALLALCLVPGRGAVKRARRVVGIGAVSAVLVLPLAWCVRGTLNAPDAAVNSATAPGWNYHSLPTNDVLTFLRGGDYYFPDTARFGNPGIAHVNYLGWVALLLVGLALWREWRDRTDTETDHSSSPRDREILQVRGLLSPAGLYGLLMLGPTLCIGKKVLTVGSMPVFLPLAIAYLPGSPFRMVHHPYRMVALALPLLALLAAVGARRLPRWGRGVAIILAVAETLWVSPAHWPIPTTDTSTPSIHAKLGDGTVLDWPPDASDWNRRYLAWQVDHGLSIPYGVNVFLPDPLREDPLVRRLLTALDDPQSRARNRDVPFRGRAVLAASGRRSRLGELGVDHLVLHREALTEAEWTRARAILRKALGEPGLQTEDEEAWTPGQ